MRALQAEVRASKNSAVRALFTDAYFSASLDAQHRVVRLARTEEPFASLAEARASYAALGRALDAVDCASHGALLDLRQTRGRHEPEFERFAADSSRALLRRFRASSILVKSAVGRLQVQRIEKERGAGAAAVFTDEQEALRHVSS